MDPLWVCLKMKSYPQWDYGGDSPMLVLDNLKLGISILCRSRQRLNPAVTLNYLG